jgi:hypothetical protein
VTGLPESNPGKRPTACTKCERGIEACEWCANPKHPDDWAAMCDCGLYDFGHHLLDCEQRAEYVYVVAIDYASAEMRM